MLSHLVESLAAECEKFLDELDDVMEMGAMVLLEGIAWSKSDVAGLFSMDHGIVPLDAGWRAYGCMTAVFLSGTVLFALTLQYWNTTFRHITDAVQNRVLKPAWIGRVRDRDNAGSEKAAVVFPHRALGETTETGIMASERTRRLEGIKNRLAHVLKRRGGQDSAGHGIDEEAGRDISSHIHYAP